MKFKPLKILKILGIIIVAIIGLFYLITWILFPDVYRTPEILDLNSIEDDNSIKYKECALKVATLMVPEDYLIDNDEEGRAWLKSDKRGVINLRTSIDTDSASEYECMLSLHYSINPFRILTEIVVGIPSGRVKLIETFRCKISGYDNFIDLLKMKNKYALSIQSFLSNHPNSTHSMLFIIDTDRITPIVKKALQTIKWNESYRDYCTNPELLQNMEKKE